MIGLERFGYPHAGTEDRMRRNSSGGGMELDRRVLCMSFRCIVYASNFLRAVKRLQKEEHDVRGSAFGARFRQIEET